MTQGNEAAGLRLSLAGKVALVTGGSRGIGAATVRLLRAAGAHVVFSYRAAEEQARTLVSECGGEDLCRAVRQELATVEDGQALIAAAVRIWGRLDCLVVNHGIWPPHDQPIATMPAEQWRTTLGVNLDSVFGLVQAGVVQMMQQPMAGAKADGGGTAVRVGAPQSALQAGVGRGFRKPETAVSEDRWNSAAAGGLGGTRGHVVLVASTAAQRGEAFHADYAASKGALLSLTKSLSSELAPKGILCNCIAPGWVRTEMSAGTLNDAEASKKALGLIPLGRAAEPEEIAGPIVFLCTPMAGFISGEVWNVNGGAVLVG
ncbi:MAG TPA: SDR family oxidoreductase [Acidobacteriaceae bacterium]|jgi:3-oxoacyl-[acyl-carrier protein] reductase|nr:SDR family oxidoreductase [Acidobacteriaceae bacterium]